MYELSNLSAVAALAFAAVLIATNCAGDVRRLVSARNVFILSIVAWYLIEALIVPDELLKYSQSQYDSAVLHVVLCLAMFSIAYHFSSSGTVFDGAFHRLAAIDQPEILWRIFIYAILIGFIPLVVIAQGNVFMIFEDAFLPRARWSSPFQRGQYGGVRDAFLELQMFLRAGIPLAAAVAFSVRFRTSRRLVALAFLTYAFFRAFNSGTRSQVVEVFLPIAGAYYWTLSAKWKKKAIYFGVPALVVTALIWSAATVVSRNRGGIDIEGAFGAKYVGFEMFRELLYLQAAVPERSDYKMGLTYYVQLVNPVPRFLWPGKPDGDAGIELSRLQGSVEGGRAFLTTAPGLIGEMHWNFGSLGIIAISGLLGFVGRCWDRIEPLAEQSLVAFAVFGAGLAIVFLSGRSFHMPTLYSLIALLVMLVFFSRQPA